MIATDRISPRLLDLADRPHRLPQKPLGIDGVVFYVADNCLWCSTSSVNGLNGKWHMSDAVRKFCITLGWWLSSCRRRSWATTTLHREPDMCRYPDPQHLWWQSFPSCQSRAMEQFTATSQRCWLTIQSVLAVTKDIFVWIVGATVQCELF